MANCPNCQQEIDKIFISGSSCLVLDKGIWELHHETDTHHCSNCYEELSPAELDTLGVPNELR